MKTRNTAANTFFGIRPLLIGVLLAILVSTVGLLLSALLMTAWDVSQELATAFSVISAAIGSFVGGLVAAALSKQRGWLTGVVCGAALFLLVLMIGLLVHRSADIGFLFVKLAVLLFGGMIGGMVGVNRK